jgi:very-short-patch-repair endonuclease
LRLGQKTFTARHLRHDETLAEKRLWAQLRNRQCAGLKFVRQSPAGPYIADFLCREMRFIVEVDGATHSTDAEVARDHARTQHLKHLGYTVFRVQNDEVIHGMDEVLTLIRDAVASVPSPIPSLRDGPLSSPAQEAGEDLLSSPAFSAGEEGAPLRSNGGDEGPQIQKGIVS